MSQITPLAQLQTVLAETFVSDENIQYKIELKPGLSASEIELLALQFPAQRLPPTIKELLLYTSGFDFHPLLNISFDAIGAFKMETIFPYSVKLASDSFGNVWLVDIDAEGNWGAVFFISQDPPVIVKHSSDITSFIRHLYEFGNKERMSNIDRIREKIIFDIWENPDGFIDIKNARNSSDTVLKEFADNLPSNYVIADLREKPKRSGFSWGKFGPDISKAKRYQSEHLWAIETRKGILSKLFR